MGTGLVGLIPLRNGLDTRPHPHQGISRSAVSRPFPLTLALIPRRLRDFLVRNPRGRSASGSLPFSPEDKSISEPGSAGRKSYWLRCPHKDPAVGLYPPKAEWKGRRFLSRPLDLCS